MIEIVDTYYGSVPFSFCDALISIDVNSNNKNFSSVNGVLFSKDGATLIAYPAGRNGNYIVPTAVKNIEHGAFYNCRKLTSLVIPEGVANIADNEFAGCVNLNSISIPKSVINVGAWPFSGCNALEDIYYTGSSTDWTNITFDEDFGLPEYVLIHYNTSVPHYDSGIMRKEATCTVDGEKIYICPCGYSKTKIVSALGHDGEFVNTVSSTCVEKGYTEYRCNTCGVAYVDDYILELGHTIENDICINCNKVKEDCIESSHNYDNNCDETWVINKANADYITVTFSSTTETETFCDYIYIYDMSDNLIGKYTGMSLASQTITVDGNIVKIRLTSDSSITCYGFAVSDITIGYEYVELSENDVKISATRNEIDSGVELAVEIIKEDSMVDDIIKNNVGNYLVGNSVLYDISLMKNNQKVQPNGEITIYIPVPESMDITNCKVFYIDDLGNAVDMNAVYEDGYMVFTTDHFSYYAIIEFETLLYGDATGDGGIDGKDCIRIKNYLANYDYDTESSTVEICDGADANGDGTIDGRDVVRLKNYLANYDYDTESSTVVLGPQT